ncbi:hypothetical protein [Mycetocola zhadangensis]|uniref:Uncharacterized protein n=1 Tax=Mycetocola zhadangensis TaxID=1164595 RepID=A0A3L7J0N5_9MICO|nr:hypothetical protein [Mycetocola zhadangensis]RLQ84023.1 hypothetical protein D9V28_07190 [Mycetocola zhadangensis]GGE96814.1 hypothetical protein GCM10011313_19790 [Mycetocola zhadangensis]
MLLESELVFAAVGADTENLESAPALDAAVIAELMNRYDFVTAEGIPATVGGLTRDGIHEFASSETPAAISALSDGGALRALFIELLHPDDQRVHSLVMAFDALGSSSGYRLASEDAMTEHDS